MATNIRNKTSFSARPAEPADGHIPILRTPSPIRDSELSSIVQCGDQTAWDISDSICSRLPQRPSVTHKQCLNITPTATKQWRSCRPRSNCSLMPASKVKPDLFPVTELLKPPYVCLGSRVYFGRHTAVSIAVAQSAVRAICSGQ